MSPEEQLIAARLEIDGLRAAIDAHAAVVTIDLEGRAAGISADLAERKRNEKRAAQFKAISESSDDAMIAEDLDGLVTEWNAGAERIFGFAASEMVGKSIAQVIPKDFQEQDAKALEEVKQGLGVREFDSVHTCKEDRRVDVSVTVVAIRDATDQIVGISKVMRDMTNVRRTAKALSASELRYRRLFETAKDGIMILDAVTGMVVDVNPFLITLLGFSREQFLGKAIWDLGPFRDIVTNADKFVELRDKEYLRYDNMPLETSDGRKVGVEFISNVYQVSGRKVIQCNVRDVSARQRAEAALRLLREELEQRVIQRTRELEYANKELEAFSFSVSHDLRAPLRTIDGFSQAVLEDFGGLLPDEGRKQLWTIRQGARRMGLLIDDLLALSLLGRAPLNTQTVCTDVLVREVIRELEPARSGRQVTLKVGELPDCTGDPILLRQVWTNLLSNALKYSRKRDVAVLEIGCIQTDGVDTFFVRDNGTGFDLSKADKLFGVFQRFHRAGDYEGTGVGLAIVQRIVSRHGGRVWADAAVDLGATFFFTLGGGPRR